MLRTPFFRFFPKDYLADANVAVMSLEEEGAYTRLLCHCWIEGSIPADMGQLARMCRTTPEHMEKLWPNISRCFRKGRDGTCLQHPRMKMEKKVIQRRLIKASKAGEEGNKKRWRNTVQEGDIDRVPDTQAIGLGSGNHRIACASQKSEVRSHKELTPTTPPSKSARVGSEETNARYERWHRLWNESTKRDDRYLVPAVSDAYSRFDRHLAKHYPDADPETEFKRIAQHIGNDPWYAKNPGARRAVSVFGSAASVDKAIQDSRTATATARPEYRPYDEILAEGIANVQAYRAELEAAERAAGNPIH